ncbi:uncharacterized protein DDB_G0283697-like [Neodiprion virginianus]|uniref:uncharacterized protein DDB_G0283697-like n=1 Tax=Neodiprion virginianus TaxID=2961670 RepID=UPI001EE6B723|nr:uncharacterized protein DDB_G0283697-like [Neodiprion virginianus]
MKRRRPPLSNQLATQSEQRRLAKRFLQKKNRASDGRRAEEEFVRNVEKQRNVYRLPPKSDSKGEQEQEDMKEKKDMATKKQLDKIKMEADRGPEQHKKVRKESELMTKEKLADLESEAIGRDDKLERLVKKEEARERRENKKNIVVKG